MDSCCMKGAVSVGGVESVPQQVLSWHCGVGNDQSCSIWMQNRWEARLRVLSWCFVRRRIEKKGLGMFQGASWVTCPTTLRWPHTDTSPVPSAGLQRGGVAQEEHSVPVCVTLCIYSTQSKRTHVMMLSLRTYTYPWHTCFYMYCVCRVQNFCHTWQAWILSIIIYKMYVWLLDSQWMSGHSRQYMSAFLCVWCKHTRATHWAPCYMSLIQIQNISVWPRCEQCAVSQRVREERCCVYRQQPESSWNQ